MILCYSQDSEENVVGNVEKNNLKFFIISNRICTPVVRIRNLMFLKSIFNTYNVHCSYAYKKDKRTLKMFT